MRENSKIVILHYAKISPKQGDGVTGAVNNIIMYQSYYSDVFLFDESCGVLFRYENGRAVSSEKPQNIYVVLQRADIVVFHSMFDIPKSVFLTKYLCENKKPFVMVPHGCLSRQAFRQKRLKKSLALKLFYRQQIKRCSAIQYLSDGEKESSVIKNKRSIVLPNGVTLSNKNGIRKHKKTILFLGRKDIFHKGIDLLLDAISLAKDKLISNGVKVIIHGTNVNNSDSVISKRIEELLLGDVVENLGPVFGEKKESLFAESDAFILTSRFEGQPTAILEALSFGLPVIASAGTNFAPDISNYDCGITCDNNADSIAGAISEYLDSSEEKKSLWSENAINLIKNKYEWQKVERDAVDEYLEIVRRGA